MRGNIRARASVRENEKQRESACAGGRDMPPGRTSRAHSLCEPMVEVNGEGWFALTVSRVGVEQNLYSIIMNGIQQSCGEI